MTHDNFMCVNSSGLFSYLWLKSPTLTIWNNQNKRRSLATLDWADHRRWYAVSSTWPQNPGERNMNELHPILDRYFAETPVMCLGQLKQPAKRDTHQFYRQHAAAAMKLSAKPFVWRFWHLGVLPAPNQQWMRIPTWTRSANASWSQLKTAKMPNTAAQLATVKTMGLQVEKGWVWPMGWQMMRMTGEM